MPSSAELLAAYLIANGTCRAPGALSSAPVCYIGHLPPTPTHAIAVYTTGGYQDGRIMKTGRNVDKPGWQVRARSSKHMEAHATIAAVLRAVEEIRNTSVTFDSDTYILASAKVLSTPVDLGVAPDGNRDTHVTLNGTLTIRED